MEYSGLIFILAVVVGALISRLTRPVVLSRDYSNITPSNLKQGLHIYCYRGYRQIYDLSYIVVNVNDDLTADIMSVKSGQVYKSISPDVLSHMYYYKGMQ